MGQTFRTPVKEMDERQKEWFATAMVAIVLADGNVSQGEVNGLLNCISFVQDPEAVERLKKYIQFKTTPPIPNFLGWEKDIRKKAAMLLDLMEVAIADREFAAPEKEKFFELGKLLGFDYAKINQLIDAGNKFIQEME